MTLRAVCGRSVRRWPAWTIGVPLACVLFGTNLLQGTWLQKKDVRLPLRSTVGLFVEELADPLPDPYTAAAAWINANVEPDASILVLPDFACYPLMFSAPRAIYAWQFNDPVKPTYQTLPAINFRDRVPPDYIVIFGRAGSPGNSITLDGIIPYPLAATLNVYGEARYRPELFWRIFRPPPPFDPAVDGIRFYKR
jgi:hypothetical protein